MNHLYNIPLEMRFTNSTQMNLQNKTECDGVFSSSMLLCITVPEPDRRHAANTRECLGKCITVGISQRFGNLIDSEIAVIQHPARTVHADLFDDGARRLRKVLIAEFPEPGKTHSELPCDFLRIEIFPAAAPEHLPENGRQSPECPPFVLLMRSRRIRCE